MLVVGFLLETYLVVYELLDDCRLMAESSKMLEKYKWNSQTRARRFIQDIHAENYSANVTNQNSSLYSP